MTCRVVGAPKPTIKWTLNDKKRLTGGKYSLNENGDLTITDVQFDDRGTYECYAENKFGNTKAEAKLIVKSN